MKVHIMKKWVILILFLILIGVTACKEEEKSEPHKETKMEDTSELDEQEPDSNVVEKIVLKGSDDGSKGFLWKAENNGNTVYLLGSIHVATEDFYPLHAKMIEAFNNSDYLVVEADVLNINPFKMQQLVDEKGKYTDGTTIEDHIPEDIYASLESKFQEFALPITFFNQYEPWYLYMLIDGLNVTKLGYDSNLGIDYQFLKSVADDQEIIELESVDFQLDLFDSFSPEVQEYLLSSILEDDETAAKDIKEMAEAWKNGDEEAMKSLLFNTEEEETSEEEQIFMTELLDKRNVNMTEKIEGFLTSDNQEVYFVIVGSAHYFGEQGIVQMLEDKGYQVDKVIE